MTEMQRNGSPAPKNEEEILDLFLETSSPEESEPDILTLSEEAPASGDETEDILDLDDDALLMADETENGIIELSETLRPTVDFEHEDIFELKVETLEAEAADEEILDLSEPLASDTDLDADDILELNLEAPQTETTDEEILDLSGEARDTDLSAGSLSDMDELLSLLSDDASESPKTGQKPPSSATPHAKDLVAEGFELGEDLDAAILKERDTVGALAETMAFMPPTETPVAQSEIGGIPLSVEQMEAAIERVIDRMLGEKIDKLLATAIERSVTREIERLKRLLSE